MIRTLSTVSAPLPNTNVKKDDDAALRDVSRALESSFIAEMLKSAGVGKPRETYGGGAGEDGFSSFLVSAQADMMVKAGGFGLAEQIYQSLKQGARDE